MVDILTVLEALYIPPYFILILETEPKAPLPIYLMWI